MSFRKHLLTSAILMGSLITLLLPLNVLAQDSSLRDRLGATLGGSIELGRLGNSGMNLQERMMSALSFEALGGYRYNSELLLGLDLNYRIQPQISSASDVGGTNLKGTGWLLGFGAQYKLNEKWAIQGALDLFGRYAFDKQTAAGEDDYLHAPLGIRLKGQYIFKPDWTADVSANYIRWSKFHVGGTDHSDATAQLMIGVGVTYHFGSVINSSVPSTVQSEEQQ